jgi:hypothetical protein
MEVSGLLLSGKGLLHEEAPMYEHWLRCLIFSLWKVKPQGEDIPKIRGLWETKRSQVWTPHFCECPLLTSPWAILTIKHETNTIMNLNKYRSWGIGRGRLLTPYLAGMGGILCILGWQVDIISLPLLRSRYKIVRSLLFFGRDIHM